MFVRSLARASTLLGTLIGGLLTILAPAAHATPPTITGTPVTAAIPDIDDPPVAINLRELGVISGAGPLTIDIQTLQILVNGNQAGGLSVDLFPNNGPGRACIFILNQDFTVGPGQNFTLRLAVSNQTGATAGPVEVPITNTPGPTIDSTAEGDLCNEPNDPPAANAGPDRTLNDVDGQPGESVTLDASGTTDPDPDNTLTYTWFDGANRAAIAGPSTSPTAVVTLGAGLPVGAEFAH